MATSCKKRKGKRNPAEMVVLGANPAKRRSRKNPAELVVLAANPSASDIRTARERAKQIRAAADLHERNPGAAQDAAGEAYQEFHGEAPTVVESLHEPEPRPQTLSEIGDLIELKIERFAGWKWGSLDFTGRGVKVAQNAAGTQLYFLSGDQKLTRGDFTAIGADRTKELIDLGNCRYIAYRTKKVQLDGITATYEHAFGEETHQYPRLLLDRRGPEPRLLLSGGAYHVDARGIVN